MLEAAKARERTAALDSKALQLQSESIQLQRRLEEERTNRIKLQAALSSRHITPEQADMIISELSGKSASIIIMFTSDAESLAFTLDIIGAFQKAGVTVCPQGSGYMVPRLRTHSIHVLMIAARARPDR
jgi:hypothetical protein